MKTRQRGECLLIISDDEALYRRAAEELEPGGCEVRRLSPDHADSQFWRSCDHFPGVILLDVDEKDLDKAVGILRGLKRARVPSPVIAVTANFSHEFGTKIVSEGICYHLLRDFGSRELGEVVMSLIRPQKSSELQHDVEQQSMNPKERGAL